MKKNGNEKTELKLQKKYTLSDNWNTYDPFGEAFFFAAGPFWLIEYRIDFRTLMVTESC